MLLVRIKSGLTPEEVAYFLERRDQFTGIEVIEESIRHYDSDKVAVQAIGYLKKFESTEALKAYDNIRELIRHDDPALQYIPDELVGFDGLELYYREELRREKRL